MRLYTTDPTIEALSDILKGGGEYSKLALIVDELAGLFGGFGRYSGQGGAERAAFLKAYDGGPEHIDRVKRGHVFVPNWSLVIAGNIQPRKIASWARPDRRRAVSAFSHDPRQAFIRARGR